MVITLLLSHASRTETHSFHLKTNFEPYSHVVTFLKIFCFSDTRLDGHKVAAIFGEQGSLPPGSADPNKDRNQ
jgi:hypothetical protein